MRLPFFRRRQREQDLDEELQAHLDIEVSQLLGRGYSPEEAEAQARRSFGNAGLVREVTRASWGNTWLERFWQDARYGGRVLRRSPGFTVAAVLSLAFGIGAAIAVFSIADTVLLRPLPYSRPQQLVWVGVEFPSIHAAFLPSPDYVAWQRDNKVFDQFAATPAGIASTLVISTGQTTFETSVGRASANFFPMFDARAEIGRLFRRQDNLPGAAPVLLLTHNLWVTRFDRDLKIVGKIVKVDGVSYSIAGVLAPSFQLPFDEAVEAFEPLPVNPAATHHDREMMTWQTFGRLKPGVTIEQAGANLNTLFAASKADAPRMFRNDNRLVVESLQKHRIGDSNRILEFLLATVCCLLLIACANVANLLLGRWSARYRELAVRSALGASRHRILGQLLIESGLLTLASAVIASCALGIVLKAFAHYAGNEIARLNEVHVDARVLAIAVGLSLFTLLVFGVGPAWRTGKVNLQAAFQQAGRSNAAKGQRILQRFLVSIEVGLCFVLVAGSALLLQSLWHLENDHLGFQPDHLVSINVGLRGTKFEKSGHESLIEELRQKIRSIPGTSDLSVSGCAPPSVAEMFVTFSRSDRPLPEPFHRGDGIQVCSTDANYFKTINAPILVGRSFTTDEVRRGRPVAIINQAAQRAYFPGENPLGKRIGRNPWLTVVGVVADSKNQGLNQPAAPAMYKADLHLADRSSLPLLVRTVADPKAFESSFGSELRALDPGLFAGVNTVEQRMNKSTASQRFNAVLITFFGLLALVTALVGVYGVLALAVSQRTQELGIRMALGATPGQVLSMVMAEAVRLLAAGLLLGIAGSLLLARFLTSLLYEVRPSDLRTYALTVAGLSAAAMLASLLPARRAAMVDPAAAIRHD